jgi:DNA-binding NarL/FixJ family response regulator
MGSTEMSPETRAKRRILIVDDHPLVRLGLTALIKNEPDLTVCAAVATHREGLEAIASSRPDLVIAEISLEEGDGLAMVKEIRAGHEELPVLLLTMHDAPLYARGALQAGVLGYVSKKEMTETLLIAIRCVLGGEKFVSREIKAALDAS